MFNAVGKSFSFVRARWRWVHGRCPLCNRDLFASSPSPTAGSARCRACQDTTPADLRMGLWGGLVDFSAEEDRLSSPDSVPAEAGR